jgi:predicted transposase YdaD
MAQKADIGSKRLISLAPDAWVQWVTQQPDVKAQEIIDAQFQWVSRDSDVLIKAFSPQHGEFLILTEIQLRYLKTMPYRMRAYTALAGEKYQLPVYPVLINILPPSDSVVVSERFEEEFLGLQARQDYQVINLWEVDVQLVFEQSLTALLPFVPILQGGNDEAVIRQAVQLLQQDEELSELESLLAFFASFVLDTELVAQILRWDMVVLRESPWYQEILQEGERKGKQEGRQEGLEEGSQQEARSLVLRQLDRKLGTIPPDVRSTTSTLSLTKLESLGEALLDFVSIEDLIQWL